METNCPPNCPLCLHEQLEREEYVEEDETEESEPEETEDQTQK